MLLAKPLINPGEIVPNTSVSITQDTSSYSSSETTNQDATDITKLSNVSDNQDHFSNTKEIKIKASTKGLLDIEIAPEATENGANDDVVTDFPNLSSTSDNQDQISNKKEIKGAQTSKGTLDIEIAPETTENFVDKDATIRIEGNQDFYPSFYISSSA